MCVKIVQKKLRVKTFLRHIDGLMHMVKLQLM